MDNKKGFTLVEMLAVITLLIIVMAVALPNIISSINRNKESQWNTTLELIYSAVDIYVDDISSNIPELKIPGSKIKVPIRYLMEKDLLKENLTDPRDDSMIDIYSEVLITVDDNKIKRYSYPAKCSSEECITIEAPR